MKHNDTPEHIPGVPGVLIYGTVFDIDNAEGQKMVKDGSGRFKEYKGKGGKAPTATKEKSTKKSNKRR